MTKFVFPLKGAHCSSCEGNLQSILNDSTTPTFFTFKHIKVSANHAKLEVEINDNVTSKELVHRYITQTLVGTPYALVIESARSYWIRGALGLGVGGLILLVSLSVGLAFWPLKLVVAALSLVLTYGLGKESLQGAEIEWQRRKPAMDSLFVMSTFLSTVISVLALFIPGLPIMFESSLLIFGFRHLGIALKKSNYAAANLPIRYQHLNAHRTQRVHPDDEFSSRTQALNPGDVIAIAAGEMIPIDGWLLPEKSGDHTQSYAMDVSRIKGAYLPEYLSVGDRVSAGMVTKRPCIMQVGLGHSLQFFKQNPKKYCPKGEIWVYPSSSGSSITVEARTDLEERRVQFDLTAEALTDNHGHCYQAEILNALCLGTLRHPQAERARQQLQRGLVKYAAQQGLTQTSSFLARLDQLLEDASCQAAPIQNATERMLQYFVPIVLGVAIVSGAVIAYFFTPLIAVQCMISILVSACPCTLAFITPLVMDFGRAKGKKSGIMFNHADAIESLDKVDVVLLDVNGTATEGRPKAQIMMHVADPEHEIAMDLARLEQHCSEHPIGAAIYAAVNGDALLRDTWCLPPEAIERHEGGIRAWMHDKYYLVGNSHLLQKYGVTMQDPMPNTNYLFVETGGQYQCLATIPMYDPLREDTALAVQQMKQRGLKVYLLTGSDKKTAENYAHDIPGLDGMYVNYFELEGEHSKAHVVRDLQECKGHRVLMIGDGSNDTTAMKLAYSSIAMKHALSDEGAQYQAKAQILNGKMMAVIDALDIAKQAMWRVHFNLVLSLIYNLAAVLLTNIMVLVMSVVLHPGLCAALMVVQIGFVLMSTYYFKHQVLPSKNLEGAHSASPESLSLVGRRNSTPLSQTNMFSREVLLADMPSYLSNVI